MPSTSASDSKTARKMARRSPRVPVVECAAPALGAGAGVGLAAWASTPAAPTLTSAAAPPAPSVLKAIAARGFMSFSSVVFDPVGSTLTMRNSGQTVVAIPSVFCNGPETVGIEFSNRGELRLGRRRRFGYIVRNLQVPARFAAHLGDGVAGMHRGQLGFTAALWKAQHAQRRDYRHRPSPEEPVRLAPAWTSVAVARRGDERHAFDQPAPFMAHQRHPAAAEDCDVSASPAPRQLDLR